MGCAESNIDNKYSECIRQAGEGESEVRRHPMFREKLLDCFSGGINTLQGAFLNSVAKFANRNYLGTLVNEKEYKFITYKETQVLATKLASGQNDLILLSISIAALNLAPKVKEFKDYELQMFGVFAKNRVEWLLLDIASILYGYQIVPFYETLGSLENFIYSLGPEAIPFILLQTNLRTMFVSSNPVKTLLNLPEGQTGELKNIVLLDQISKDEMAQLKARKWNVYTFQEIQERGEQLNIGMPSIKPDDIYTFCYTSGTTGNPKGALLTQQNILVNCASLGYSDINLNQNDVHLSYLPLPHIMERLTVHSMMCYGGSIGFFRGDVLKLKDDIAILKPTIFVSVPRLYNKFCDGIKQKIEAVTGSKRSFAEKAIATKLANLRSSAKLTHFLYDKAFAAVRELFGGRCRLMITGSAPIQKDVIDFLKIASNCPIFEGYGQTESSGGSFVTAAWDPKSGHVGGPTAHTEFKLVDVPEMNYTSKDIIDNCKAPRGEICVRGPGVFKGYYKDDEKTAETVDSDGWLHTGDVGMILPNGGLKIIDRKKNIFKLQQGEYIAPDKIEGIYNRTKGVAEVFVYGDSLQNFCVAIVVPDQIIMEKMAKDMGIEGNFEQLCMNEQIKKQFLENMKATGKQYNLNSLEQVQKIYLEPKSFQMLGCTTATLKIQRHQAKQMFQSQINQMYAQN